MPPEKACTEQPFREDAFRLAISDSAASSPRLAEETIFAHDTMEGDPPPYIMTPSARWCAAIGRIFLRPLARGVHF